MKRLILCLGLAAVLCGFVVAEEKVNTALAANNSSSANIQYRITNGGFWSCGQDFSGGFGEFGINLLPKENFLVLRDCIYVQGLGGNRSVNSEQDFGGLEIGDKLIIGGRTNGEGFIVRTYGFTSVAAGFYSYEGHKFGSFPLMLNLTFGGGFEFQYVKHTALVLEFGGVNRLFPEGFSKSSSVLTIGFRSFR